MTKRNPNYSFERNIRFVFAQLMWECGGEFNEKFLVEATRITIPLLWEICRRCGLTQESSIGFLTEITKKTNEFVLSDEDFSKP